MANVPTAPANVAPIGACSIVAASAGISNSETVIMQTGPLSANRLTVGTVVRAVFIGTCTSSATNVPTFALRIGTAGTTSDTSVCSVALAAAAASGTAIPFELYIDMTVRTVGSAATAYGLGTLINAGTTGISTSTVQAVVASMSTWDTTAEGNIISGTFVAAAATTTCTFQEAFITLIFRN